jgi:hypothetical protein
MAHRFRWNGQRCRFGDDWELGLPLLVLFLLGAICLVLVFGRLLTRTAME